MEKVILMPDSFKGTMSSAEICGIMAKAVKAHYPKCEIVSIPVADGGEGTVDSFLNAVGGEKIHLPVRGPFMEEVDGFYGILPSGTAVIEMAAAAGLPLAGENLNPRTATTYGVGQLLLDAVKRGCKDIVLGLGGSATNDMGCGAAAAVGVKFFNADGKEFVPAGDSLGKIVRIDASEAAKILSGVNIVTMCDIDNPLFGKTGAAYVFGPQKGADEKTVELLDENLRAASAVVKAELGANVADMPGAGAAGGMGAGTVAFLGAKLQMGIEAVLDTVKFETLAKGADMIFTGEGKIDSQSLRGKVVIGIGKRAKALGIPVVAIVGDIAGDVSAAYQMGIAGIFSINRLAVPFSEAKKTAAQDLYLTVENLMRCLARLNNSFGRH